MGGFGCTVDHNITAGNSLSSTFSRVTLDELWGYIGCLTMNDLVATANWVHTNAGGGSPDPLHVLYDRWQRKMKTWTPLLVPVYGLSRMVPCLSVIFDEEIFPEI